MAQKKENGKMKMPGYEQKVDADEASLERKRRMEKEANDARRAAELANAAAKLRKDKRNAIHETLPLDKEVRNLKKRIGAIASGIQIAGLSQLVFFVLGSGAHYIDTHDSYWEEEIDGVLNVHTPNDFYHGVSYGQAVKNAYLFDDLIHGNEGGAWQAIAGLVAILISLELGRRELKEKFEDIESLKSERRHRWEYIDSVYSRLETLKEYGVNVEHLIYGFKDYAAKLVSKMSEMDRGYLENLLNGGLENANWDVANAIVAGHLKSHPEDYNEIIKIIDESTMDPALVKKYGKGKTISFGAAAAMMSTKGYEK